MFDLGLAGDASAGAQVDWEPLGGPGSGGESEGSWSPAPSRFGDSGSVHRDMWIIWLVSVGVLVFAFGALRSY